MGRRLILDTSILVELERGRLDFSQLVDRGDDICIAAVSVAEFRLGIELADEAHRKLRETYLSELLRIIRVLPYTEQTAAFHGKLLAATRGDGQVRGAHDLIIAAQAMESGSILVSTDKRAHFASLPGIIAIIHPVG